MNLINCVCGHIPHYWGNDTWGYVECGNCHKRTNNYVDVDCRVEYGKDNYGNVGYIKRYHKPCADVLAAEAWNDMILAKEN